MTSANETPDRYRWVILGVLWITYLVVFLHRLSIGPLAPFLKQSFDITSTQVGLLMSAASLGYMVSMFPTGWFVDRIGARRPIIMGALIAGTCMLALFFIDSYPWLVTLTFLTGLGSGFLFPSTTQGVIAWFPPRERATAMGFKQTAVNIGGIVSAATLPAIALTLGWRYCFLILGFFSLAIGGAAFLLYRNPPLHPFPAGPSASKDSLSLKEILRSREIWLIAFCGMCLNWFEMTLITYLVLYLKEVLMFGVVSAGVLLAMVEAGGAIARPGGGILSDGVFRGNRKKVFMLMAATASVTSLLVGLLGPHLSWLLYPVLLLMGMGGLGFGGIYLTLLSEFAGRRGAGKAVGLGGILTLLGSVIGPAVFGRILDTSGSYTFSWLSLTLVSTVCLFFLLLVKEEKRKI